VFLQTITGAYTPACLSAANDPVETVTPPIWDAEACVISDPAEMLVAFKELRLLYAHSGFVVHRRCGRVSIQFVTRRVIVAMR
jgi:hypothetical protein